MHNHMQGYLHPSPAQQQGYDYYDQSNIYSESEEWVEMMRFPTSMPDEISSAVAFDQSHEMLWVGYSNVNTCTYKDVIKYLVNPLFINGIGTIDIVFSANFRQIFECPVKPKRDQATPSMLRVCCIDTSSHILCSSTLFRKRKTTSTIVL
jgi:hypothetical protein